MANPNIEKSCLREKGVIFINGIQIHRKVKKIGSKHKMPEEQENILLLLLFTFIMLNLPPLVLLVISYYNPLFGNWKEYICKLAVCMIGWIYGLPTAKQGAVFYYMLLVTMYSPYIYMIIIECLSM